MEALSRSRATAARTSKGSWSLVAIALCCAAAGTAFAAEPLRAGDRTHARDLWQLHCAACHAQGEAPTAPGKALGVPRLRDPSLLAARTDEQLIATILKGGPSAGSPAFGKWLSLLDAADLVALLRAPLPAVQDVFADAAAYTVKRYAIAGNQLARAESLAGPLGADERELSVFSVYGGERSALGPRLVPQDPRKLDQLAPRSKLGYLVFGAVPGPKGEPGEVALGLTSDFVVAQLVAGQGQPDVKTLVPSVLGKGGRDPGKRKPFVVKAAPERAKALTRLYARAVEAAAAAAREEAELHLFDPPEVVKGARAQER